MTCSDDSYKLVLAKFRNGKSYFWKCSTDIETNAGDFLLVENKKGVSIVQIVDDNPLYIVEGEAKKVHKKVLFNLTTTNLVWDLAAGLLKYYGIPIDDENIEIFTCKRLDKPLELAYSLGDTITRMDDEQAVAYSIVRCVAELLKDERNKKYARDLPKSM